MDCVHKCIASCLTSPASSVYEGCHMVEHLSINVRAKECKVAGKHGRRFVRYQGETHEVSGWYFALRPSGQVELHYVLSTVQGQLQSPTKPSGRMRQGKGRRFPLLDLISIKRRRPAAMSLDKRNASLNDRQRIAEDPIS